MVRELAKNTIYSRRWVIDMLLFILIVALLFILAGLRVTNNRILQVGRQNTTILKEVKSCTDPIGACAQRGNQTTRDAVSNINNITIYAAYCASKQQPPVSADAVKRCVEQELEGK